MIFAPIILASFELFCGYQFSAECKPPVPARKAMFMRQGIPAFTAGRERCCRKRQFDRLCS
jgi:hypothetical protein